MWTTGWSSRPSSPDSGPPGCRQSASRTPNHHGVPAAGPITASAGAATARWNTAENPKLSASVTNPVAATNRRKSAFVTGVASIENASTATLCTGRSPSPGLPSPWASPIAKT
jgi:hypothetical protein